MPKRPPNSNQTPIDQRHCVTVVEAADFCSVSESFIWQKIADGTLRTCKLGRRRLVIVESLMAMLEPVARAEAG